MTAGIPTIPDTLKTPHPLFLEPVPAGERLSRAELVEIADSYFTGLDTEESGRHVPFDPLCLPRAAHRGARGGCAVGVR